MAENSRRAVVAHAKAKGLEVIKIENGWALSDGDQTVNMRTDEQDSMPAYWAWLHETIETFTHKPASKETTPSLDVPLPDAGSFFEEDDGFVPPPTMTSGVGDLQPSPPQKGFTKMTTSGFCKWPGVENQGHALCQKNNPHPCDCACHLEEEEGND